MKENLRRILVLGMFTCASLLFLTPASAQSVYGSIFGTVTDKTGAAIPGATVTVTDEAKNTAVSVTSNAIRRLQRSPPHPRRIRPQGHGQGLQII